MSKRRDSDLKERLMALKVNEPLKLKKESLVFTAPQEEKEVPRNEAPPAVLDRIEGTQDKAPQSCLAKAPTPVGSPGDRSKSEEPQNEASSNKDAGPELRQKEDP